MRDAYNALSLFNFENKKHFFEKKAAEKKVVDATIALGITAQAKKAVPAQASAGHDFYNVHAVPFM